MILLCTSLGSTDQEQKDQDIVHMPVPVCELLQPAPGQVLLLLVVLSSCA